MRLSAHFIQTDTKDNLLQHFTIVILGFGLIDRLFDLLKQLLFKLDIDVLLERRQFLDNDLKMAQTFDFEDIVLNLFEDERVWNVPQFDVVHELVLVEGTEPPKDGS